MLQRNEDNSHLIADRTAYRLDETYDSDSYFQFDSDSRERTSLTGRSLGTDFHFHRDWRDE